MRLSICIPTYNRAEYLPELFDSILAQLEYGCEVEVVVADNASTDNTRDVIDRYRSRFSHFIYYSAPTNMGADRNFLKVVDLAEGDYCWLMGSDDRLEPGAIAAIEKTLADHPNVAGLSVRNYSYNLKMTMLISSFATAPIFPRTTLIKGDEAIFLAVGQYIGFLSGNVVNRSRWSEVVSANDFTSYLNGWIHAYIIGRMIQQQPEWVYVAHPCVGWRSGNDSFLSEGMYRRLEIDVAGYDQVVTGLFGKNSAVHQHTIRESLPHARYRVLHAKAHGAPPSFFSQARVLLVSHYGRSPRFWLSCYPIFFLPSSLLKVARKIRRAAKNG
ncbi:glycosyltransferase family 2 protein [Sphingomonas cynarae]|uniref:Glycosyltransferase family 2 protein n=1 Tax=Sphingomonas cynarae TaxID=930197 RepID=A0ABP7EQL4_9SPHN